MAQEQKTAETHKPTPDDDESVPIVDLRNPKLDKAIDDILDEIDEVLEENAEAFVKNYVQKGGQ